jgi:hypothetical protein
MMTPTQISSELFEIELKLSKGGVILNELVNGWFSKPNYNIHGGQNDKKMEAEFFLYEYPNIQMMMNIVADYYFSAKKAVEKLQEEI